MAQKVRITSYMRNVGRSLGYTVKDLVSEYAPTMDSIARETKSTYQDIKFSLQDMKNSSSNYIKDFNSGSNFLSNSLEDLKTGKWYNKEREDQSLFGDLGGDDWDFDDDWGDDDDLSSSDVIESDQNNTQQVIKAMSGMSEDVSKSVAYSTARSAEYVVANSNANSRALYELNYKGFNQVSNILLGMNNTMNGILQLAQPLATHMQNSAVFYTNTTQALNKISSNLDILVERTAYLDSKNKSNVKVGRSYSSFMSGGSFDLGGYLDMVKESSKDTIDMIKSFVDMGKMMMGNKGQNTSLPQMLLKGGVDKLIPKITKEIIKQFDETISNTLGNGLMRAGKSMRGKGGIFGLLANFFLPEERVAGKFNNAGYNKGPTQWDGIAKQSLTYVIPTYLAQMTALLAGVNDEQDYQYYDFDRGKFTTKRIYNKEKELKNRTKAKAVGGNFRTQALGATDNEAIRQEIEEFFYQSMMKGGDFYNIRKGKTDADWRKKYGNLSEETVDLLVQIIESNYKNGGKNVNNQSNWEARNNAQIAENYYNQKQRELNGYDFEGRYSDGTENYRLVSAVGGGRRSGSGEKNRSVSGYTNTSGMTTSSNYRENKDGTYTVGSNNVVLDANQFSKWLTAFEKNDTDALEKIERSAAAKQAKNYISNMGKDIANNMLPEGEQKDKNKIMKLLEKGRDVIQAPMYAVTYALDSLNRGINQLFWGPDGHSGIIEKITNKLTDLWGKIKEKFFGNKDGEESMSLKDAMAAEMHNIGRGIKDKFNSSKEKYKAQVAHYKELEAGMNDNGNAAKGRQITRSGFAIVSEGELIIPSEFNPYYHGATNKASQIANERRIRNNFFGSYAEGGYVQLGKSNIYQDSDKNFYSFSNGNYTKLDPKNKDDKAAIIAGYKNAAANSGAVGAVAEGAKTLVGGIWNFVTQVIGGDKKEKEAEKEKNKILENIGKVSGDLGMAKGAMGIGAVTGVGVSLLTGAVVGPLAGAAIGAGVGLATKSQAFQDILFGTGDPDSDNYKKGLLGELGKRLKTVEGKESAKGTGIGAGVGLVGGTLLGSPILGMIAGSAIGYAAKSQKAQEWLFGTEDKKTALGELKDKVTTVAPNVMAGALGGLFLGPFGVVGNLVVGAGLGYASTTEEFHKFMFGDGGKDKGLAGKLHDKIINPIDEIMHNIGNQVAGLFRKLGGNLGDIVKGIGNKLKERAAKEEKKGSLIGKAIGGAKWLGKGIFNGTIGAVGNVLDATDTKLKKSNLNNGFGVYNSRLGRNETAAERMDTRNLMKNGGLEAKQFGDETVYYRTNANGKQKEISERKYNRLLKKNQKKGYKIDSAYGQLDQSIANMSEADIDAILNGGDVDAKLKFLELTGKKKAGTGDVNNFKKLLETEKNVRFSKENKEQDKEASIDKATNTINNEIPKTNSLLDKILYFVSGGKMGSTDSKSEDISTEENESNNTAQEVDKLTKEENKEQVQYDMFGNPHKMRENNQGELEEVENDNTTKQSKKVIDEFTSNISGIGKIGAGIGSIGGILGAIKNGLLGDDKEKKPGILSKLFGTLFGDDEDGGVLGGILQLFTGKTGGLKNIIKSIGSSGGASIIKTLLTDVGIGALIYMGFSGAFDGIASSIAGIIGGKGADDAYASKSKSETRTYDVTLSDGTTTTAAKDADGNWVDASGNKLDVTGVNSSKQNNVASFSDKLKENTVRGALTGTSSVVSKLASKTTIGKGVTKVVGAIGDSTKIASVTDDVLDGIIKFTSTLKKVPALKFMADKLDDMGLALADKVGTALASNTAKNIASIASTAVVWAKVAFIVIDFTTGYEDARTTLGIVTEPTKGQKVLSGLLRAIKNFIPIIGSLIPDSLVVDVFCNYIAPALGIDVEELKNAREYADEQVAAYNEANGTDLSKAEFTKSVMKDYTWTERIGNAASSTWEDTKTKFSNFTGSIKENGIVDTFKNMGADAINTFKDSYSANGGGIAGIMSGIGDTFGSMLPGVLGEVQQKKGQIRSLAAKGEISELWKVSLDDFSGGGEAIEGTELTTAVPGVFSKIVGQIPLLMTKLTSTPLALGAMAVNKVKDIINTDSVKSDATTFSDTTAQIKEYISSGDVGSIWKTEGKWSEDNPIKVFFNIGLTLNKMIGSILAIINKLIAPIKELIGGVADAIGGVVDYGKGVIDSVKENGIVDTAKNVGSDIYDHTIGKGVNFVKGLFNKDSGSGSGFVSQYDPRYQGYKINGENFAAKGCGPAVASMAAKAMGRNLSVNEAVMASKGYQNDNGVSIDYFQNALGSRGINTQIISGGSSADMYSRLAHGEKMILLGQDATNNSKDRSPFGPNNHYVLATGIDRRGNIIVNDPEARGPRTYSPSILASAKYAVAGSGSGLPRRILKYVSGAGTPRNDSTTQQIWSYLRTKLGMSEAAAAGVMGNLEQESGCNPNVNQKGGPAFGLCQWEGGRKTALMSQANYTSLNTQLNFMASELQGLGSYFKKSGTLTDKVDGKTYTYRSMTYDEFKRLSDVAEAVIKFEMAFERAGKPNIAKRIQYAKAYYEMFTGKSYTYDGSFETLDTSSTSSGDSTSADSSSSGSKFSILNAISTISSAFSNAFSGNKDTDSNAAARYTTSDTTSTTTGTTSNPVDPSFTSKSPVDWMKSILGKISYSMKGPRDPEKGSADCSSTVRWAIKKAGGPDIGNSTLGQLDNANLSTVWDGNGGYATEAVKNSMKENDVIFFSRPNSDFTSGRKYRVGHVGLYEGNGQYIDHGSGMGPKEKTLKFGSDGKIVRVSRIKTSGANSGIMDYTQLAAASGGASGLVMASRAGSYKPGVPVMVTRSGRLVPMNHISGGDSAIVSSMLNEVASNVSSSAKNSATVSKELVAQLLESITNILNSIADNTAPVSKIYNALVAYMGSGSGSSMDKVTVKKKDTSSQSASSNTEIDSNLKGLVGVLAELAKG